MRDIYRIIGVVLVTIVAILGIGAALHLFMSLPFDATGPNDKRAEWLGAFGTVATLAGTIWLATSETRQRHKKELLVAELQAGNMLFKMFEANRAASTLHVLVQRASREDPPHARLEQCRDLLNSVPKWTTEEIVALVPLGGRVSLNLADSADRLDYLCRTVAAEFADAGAVGYKSLQWVRLARACRRDAEQLFSRTALAIQELGKVTDRLNDPSQQGGRVQIIEIHSPSSQNKRG